MGLILSPTLRSARLSLRAASCSVPLCHHSAQSLHSAPAALTSALSEDLTYSEPHLSALCTQTSLSTLQQALYEPPVLTTLSSAPTLLSSLCLSLHIHRHTRLPLPALQTRLRRSPQVPSPRGTPVTPPRDQGCRGPGAPLIRPVPPHPGGLSQAAGTGRGAAPGGAEARSQSLGASTESSRGGTEGPWAEVDSGGASAGARGLSRTYHERQEER